MGAKTGRGTLLVLLQNAVQFGIGLLFFAIAANVLTKTEIGVISTLTFAYVMFSALAPLALQTAAAKYMAEFMGQNNREKASSVAKTTRKWVFLVSLGFLAICSGISFLIPAGSIVAPELVLLAFVYAFFSTMRVTYQAFFQGLQLFRRYAVIGIVGIALSRGLAILLMILNYGLLGIVIGWTLGEAIGFLVAVLTYRGCLPETETRYDYRILLSFSLPVLFMVVVTAASDWTDRILLLTLTSNLETLGVYDLVIRGSSTLALIWTAIGVAMLPIFSESYGKSGDRDMTRLVKTSLRYMAYFIMPASLGLAAISKSVMALLFGWGYTEGSAAMSIISLFSLVASFSIVAFTALQAMRKTTVFLRVTLATIMANLVASVILVPRLGVNGAAFARAAMMTTGFVYTFYELKRQIRVEADGKNMLKAFMASLAMAVPLTLFDMFYSGIVIRSAVLSVVIELASGVAIYGLAMLLLKTLDREDFGLLKEIMPQPLSRILDRFERFFPLAKA